MAKVLTITLKQGDAITQQIRVVDSAGAVIDVTSATFTFTAVSDPELDTVLFTVANALFDKTNGAQGLATFPISATNSTQTAKTYKAEIKTEISASNITKSTDIDLVIVNARDIVN